MSKIKIIIVEDELIIAEDLKSSLIELGYDVCGIATSYDEAMVLFNQEQPDFALIDIFIEGSLDGIELAKTLREKYKIPIVFLTSFADKKTIERAKQVKPDGYLVKPYEVKDLFASIEIAFSNFANKSEKSSPENTDNFFYKDGLFIRKDFSFVKVNFGEIQFIQADGNYVSLHCNKKTHLVRSTIKDFYNKLPKVQFIQVHRSYIVNIGQIDSISYSMIKLGDFEIPVGRSFHQNIKDKLNISF